MKTVKMSLANIQGKLSRTEMKNVRGGDDTQKGTLDDGSIPCSTATCYYIADPRDHTLTQGYCGSLTGPMQVGCGCHGVPDSGCNAK